MSAARKPKFPLRYALALTVVFLPLYGLGFFYGLDASWVDGLFWHDRASLRSGDPRIIVAAMDDETVHEYGFPPRRSMHAQLVDKLRGLGVKTVAFDVMFLEKRRFDDQLIAASKRMGRVIHLFEGDVGEDGKPNVQLPAPGIGASAQYVAYPNINRVVDADGHVRRALFFNADLADPKTGKPPALSLDAAALASFTGQPPDAVVEKYGELRDGRWKAKEYYIDFRRPIDWTKLYPAGRKPPASGVGVYTPYRTISIRDILHDRLTPREKKLFRGSIVLVGSTATGYFDHYPTPFVAAGPGVEYHCNIIDNALHGDWLRPVSGWLTALALLAFIWLPVAAASLPPMAGAAGFAVLLAGWIVLSSMLFVRGWRLEFTAPAMALVAAFLGQTVYRMLAEGQEKRFIKNLFGQFVAPEVVDDLAKDPAKVKLGGEKKDMSIFFLDIAHFTTISEKMPPEALIVFLNKYLSELTKVVHDQKGVVDKYIGDCIMAFWNAPISLPEHRTHALLAALDCQKAMERLNAQLDPGLPEIPAIRIGLNAGDVTVGLTGSEKKLQYTVIGDEVNLASRLEGANKFFGSRILASESVYGGARDAVEVRELGRVRVVGKEVPIRVFEPVARKGELSESWKKALPLFNEGVKLFEQRKYAEAQGLFQEFAAIFPDDKPGEFYLSQARDYAVIPPPEDWDGTFNLTQK